MGKKTEKKPKKKQITNGKILIFALSVLALASMVKIMQEHYTQQQYAQVAACTPPPPCMVGPHPSCYIAEPKNGWCPLPTVATPSPTPFSGFTCADCQVRGANYFCTNVQTNQQYCLRYPIKAKGFNCNVCGSITLTCIPRPSCADDKMHPCIVGPQFCPPVKL